MKIAVALHLLDYRFLNDFKACIKHVPKPFDLFVTVPDNGNEILEAFPEAKIYPNHVNQGMDIAGFLAVLPDILKDDYDIVLKLHSKTDPLWRYQLINPICGSEESVSQVISAFANPKVGGVGAMKWILRDGHNPRGTVNTIHVGELASQLDITLRPYNFVGGTMFWMRVEVLRRAFKGVNLLEKIQELNTLESCDWVWYMNYYSDLRYAGLLTKSQLLDHWETRGKAERRLPNGLAARQRGLVAACDGMIEHAYERLFGLVVELQELQWYGL